MKYTILPPQKSPILYTGFRRPGSLGEHQAAFLNSNNRYGFQVDEIPEEPIVDEMAALFLTVVGNMPKLNKKEREQERIAHHRKMVNAGYEMQNGAYVKVKTYTEEDYEQMRRDKRKLFKRSQVEQMLVRGTPSDDFQEALKDPRWKEPWNHAAYHEEHRKKVEECAATNPDHPGIFKKHIYATRSNFSHKATLLRDDEYRSRLDKLLDQLEQQSNIQNPVLRKLVALEKADGILKEKASRFISTFDIDEFLGPVEPKSEPTGQHRINPYL